MENTKLCQHISSLNTILTAKSYECEECIKSNDQWIHLRTCQTCGITLCCDDSPNKHMTGHYKKTAHSVITSAEPGEEWLWCYADEEFAEY